VPYYSHDAAAVLVGSYAAAVTERIGPMNTVSDPSRGRREAPMPKLPKLASTVGLVLWASLSGVFAVTTLPTLRGRSSKPLIFFRTAASNQIE